MTLRERGGDALLSSPLSLLLPLDELPDELEPDDESEPEDEPLELESESLPELESESLPDSESLSRPSRCCAIIIFGAFCRCSRRSSVKPPRPIDVKKLMAKRVFFGLSLGNICANDMDM